MEQNTPNMLTKDHPSYGCGQAIFLFVEGSQLIMVEADNMWKVQVIERILFEEDRTVSPTCFNIAIFRGCDDVAKRGPAMLVMSYVDFMDERVEPSRLLVDAAMTYSFRVSLSEEECRLMSAKLGRSVDTPEQGLRALPAPSPTPTAPKRVPVFETEGESVPVRSQAVENKVVRVQGALDGLGFRPAQVKKWVGNLSTVDLVREESVLLKQGITHLSA